MTRFAKPPKTVPSYDGFAGRDRNDRFSICLRRLLVTEGGFNDIPQDRGGATNFGISLRFLRAEAAINPAVRALFPAKADATTNGRPIDIEDIRALTVEQAAKIYLWCFWVPAKCDSLPAPVDGIVFDQAVNAGLRTAGRLLQKAVNAAGFLPSLIEDGAIGRQTVEAAKRVYVPDLVAAFRLIVADRYRSLVVADPSQSVFLTGWLNRAAKLGSV